MTSSEYIEKALRTESKGQYASPNINGVTDRIQHATMGMVTEAGEIMDDLKRAKYYNVPLDRGHVVEEAGDVMWYLAVLADELGVSFEEVWEKNIAKLQKRYPDKYSNDLAVNRNVDEERKIFKDT